MRNHIRSLRQSAQLTISEVARRAGIQRPKLSAIEAGTGNPTLDTLDRIAKALGVDAWELIAPMARRSVARPDRANIRARRVGGGPRVSPPPRREQKAGER